MNFDDISFINEVFKNTVAGKITWSLSHNLPPVIISGSDITIITCYQSSPSNTGSVLYIYHYRFPEYNGEYDTFFNVEKVTLSALKHDQISWQSNTDSAPIYNLLNYISSKYSGIGDFFD